MRKILATAFVLLSFMASAQAATTKDIPYGTDRKQRLDVYGASKPCPSTGCPVLVYVHGGGWRNGSKSMGISSTLGEVWGKAGAVVVSLDYRLTPDVVHPAHVQDVAAGIAWVNKNINRYGGDPHKVFIMGHSAGAHLVALVATAPQYLAAHGLQPATALAGVMPVDTASYDLANNNQRMVEGMIEDAFGTDPNVLREASPLLVIKPGAVYPPFMIATVKQREGAVAQSKALAEKLPRTTLMVRDYPGLGQLKAHGQINRDLADPTNPMTQSFMRFVGVAP